jgi:hypothetical protein
VSVDIPKVSGVSFCLDFGKIVMCYYMEIAGRVSHRSELDVGCKTQIARGMCITKLEHGRKYNADYIFTFRQSTYGFVSRRYAMPVGLSTPRVMYWTDITRTAYSLCA